MAKRALGKGLSSLISESFEEAQTEQSAEGAIQEIAVVDIHRNPNQPRVYFDEGDLEDLAGSIAQVGILQPIIVRPDKLGYEIIAGERRYQAACKAGLEKVPVIIKDIDDSKSLELALVENIQRSNLNSMEEARAYRDLIERTGITQEQLAETLSKSRSSITNALRLLDLPEEVQELVFYGDLTAGHARAILGVPTAEMRIKMAQKVVEEKLSVRQTESLVALFSVEQADKSPRPVMPTSFKKIAKQLRQDLQTNVKIKQVRGKYKIEIEFADAEDLDRLVSVMHSE